MDSVFANIDVDVLKKFDKPGPRYTSYPTAPMFSAEYTDKQFEIDLIRDNDENRDPLSLYVHIPFCDTLCYFCGCTTVITGRREKISTYLSVLKKEIERTSFYINKLRPVTQIHWGGGTPSYLTPSEILDLGTFVSERFALAPDAEFSVEIDPRGLTYDHMSAFRKIGVNRVSLGVQDFDPRVQAAVNRVQAEELTVRAIQWARTLGIRSINVDLIYGLPLQSVRSFQYTLDEVIALSPERVAAFNFAYIPRIKPQQKLIHPEDLPSPEMKLQLLKTTVESLTQAGYNYIGMDHFAKPNDELSIAQKSKTLHRNFQGYSTRAGADLIGFGMSALSHFGAVYAQNAKTLPEYFGRLNNRRFATTVGYRMNRDDEIRKSVIMQLMCNLEVVKKEVEDRFGILFDEYFENGLEQLEEFRRLGLVEHTATRISLTGAGRLLLRNIAMCFDAYLPKLQETQPVFSRTL
ncbi:MAG: oxygen-independent coproporphyrinogen III oxidase [Ignavibacteriales bacterium]|nr:oxygen-independent coproporphyrinogen III oxidase [Ignavibacteriales bacterium]